MAKSGIPINLDARIHIEVDVDAIPVSVYEWSAHGYEASPAGESRFSAVSLTAWNPEQVVDLCGRLVYLPELDAVDVRDGHEEDLACMINAVWDWSGRKPRYVKSGGSDRLLAIDRLDVPPEFRGQRVGQRSVSALLRHFPQALVATIPTSDESSSTAQEQIRTYWSKLGFASAPSDPEVYWRYT